MCRSKHLFPRNPQPRKVHVVDEYDVNSDSESTLSLDPIQIGGLAVFTVSTSSGEVNFKLDTGAEASVILIKVYRAMQHKPVIKLTNVRLTAYGGASITPIGTCNLVCKGKQKKSSIYILLSIACTMVVTLLHQCCY